MRMGKADQNQQSRHSGTIYQGTTCRAQPKSRGILPIEEEIYVFSLAGRSNADIGVADGGASSVGGSGFDNPFPPVAFCAGIQVKTVSVPDDFN